MVADPTCQRRGRPPIVLEERRSGIGDGAEDSCQCETDDQRHPDQGGCSDRYPHPRHHPCPSIGGDCSRARHPFASPPPTRKRAPPASGARGVALLPLEKIYVLGGRGASPAATT